ncbi:diacylglycerol kinase family protein [Microbacterium sp. 18062]|uniref:diacylglycerol/lipid kinase family protein n=1 Tax=Microbacterium sp. 18062 TaxID=2681410 RepID=UPI001359EDFE|nr:diacylglycerol kinase family protein [Microbacterium sp. 18062]
MTSSRIGIVFNPSKIAKAELSAAIDDVLPDADVAWFETTPEDPGQGPAREALDAGCGIVIAAGGDGTVRAVAEVLAGTDAHLGIVPQGTGNLLARNLGVPLGDVKAALARVADVTPRSIDIGWVDLERDGGPETHGFVVMVGFGLDAQMLAETDDDLKDKAGWLAYVEALGRAVSSSEVVEASIAVDDEKPKDVAAHTVLIGNCGTIQGGVTLLPDAAPDDGSLDILVVNADGALQWLDTLKSVVWDNGIMRMFDRDKQATSTDTVQHRQAARVRVRLPHPLAFEIDGEEIGEVQGFTARIDAGALHVR